MATFTRNPGWRIPRFPAYSLLIPEIVPTGIWKNLAILGKWPECCSPSPYNVQYVILITFIPLIQVTSWDKQLLLVGFTHCVFQYVCVCVCVSTLAWVCVNCCALCCVVGPFSLSLAHGMGNGFCPDIDVAFCNSACRCGGYNHIRAWDVFQRWEGVCFTIDGFSRLPIPQVSTSYCS